MNRITKIHPLSILLGGVIGRTHYIYTQGSTYISVVHLMLPSGGWGWEAYGGKFRHPTSFKRLKDVEAEIKKRYKIGTITYSR